MEIEIIKVGELDTNCYILTKNNSTIIIDPGDEPNKIINYLEKNKLNLVTILITHSHFDHVGALKQLLDYKNVEVLNNDNLKEQKYNIHDFEIEVIKTYGHTSDSITFFIDNIMFVGDFIFKNSIGRTDLGGNISDMYKSLDKIKKYDDNITIYPGHGPKTTLGYEKQNNPYLR